MFLKRMGLYAGWKPIGAYLSLKSDASDESIGCSGVGAPASLPAYNQLR
ncbi:MAG: hypothetical protein PHG44_09975 [Lentisphaeria bacterium]|nr:hypothetical protein [Lentisphaeria bacterium]